MKPTVFIPEHIAEVGLDLLRAECECLIPWADSAISPDEFDTEGYRDPLFQADAVIVRLFKINRDDIARGRLKVIAKHGVGVDNIDCEAATAAGIPVVFTPNANANAVAEHTLALMLALARQIRPASEALMAGRFDERSRFSGVELRGKVLGVVGLGKIGSRVAAMAFHGMGMKIQAYDPFVPRKDIPDWIGIKDSLKELMSAADFISLHLPLTSETKYLINRQRLGWVKSGCRIINTSRGPIIDEAALVQALKSGDIAGAALDVFEQEPLPVDHQLLQAPNVLLTPHISSSTCESLENMSLQAAQGLLDVLHGRQPPDIANPEVRKNH